MPQHYEKSYTFMEKCKMSGFEGLGEVAEAENQRKTKEETEDFEKQVRNIVGSLKGDFQKAEDAYRLLERELPKKMIYGTPTQLREDLNERVLDRVFGEEMTISIDDDPERELTVFNGDDTWENYREAYTHLMIGVQDLNKEAKYAKKRTDERRMAAWERLLKVHPKEMAKMGYGRNRAGPTNLPVDWFKAWFPEFQYKAMEMSVTNNRIDLLAADVYRDKETLRYATIEMMEARGETIDSD